MNFKILILLYNTIFLLRKICYLFLKMDADYDPNMIESTVGKKKGKFAEAIQKKKPVFDPSNKKVIFLFY